MGTKSELKSTTVLPASVLGSGFTFHPAALHYPRLPDDEQKALADNIAANGLQQRIIYRMADSKPEVIEGVGRFIALDANGVTLMAGSLPDPKYFEKRVFANEAEIRAYIKSANFFRRHLTSAQKREHAADELRADPSQSDRKIGEKIGADKNTVKAVRSELESTGAIHQLEKTVGKDGKARTTKPKATTSAKPKKAASTSHAAKLIRKYAATGELFSVVDGGVTCGNIADSYVAETILPLFERTPVDGFVAWRKTGSENASKHDKVWKIVPVAGVELPKPKPAEAIEEPAEPQEPQAAEPKASTLFEPDSMGAEMMRFFPRDLVRRERAAIEGSVTMIVRALDAMVDARALKLGGERHEKALRVLRDQSRKFPLTKAEGKTFQKALSPDNVASVEVRNEALRIFEERKHLFYPANDRPLPEPLPVDHFESATRRADLMDAKAARNEARKAAREAAAANQ